MFRIWISLAAILLTFCLTQASEITGTNVASNLRICYNTTELHDHDQRLPATMNMFIDLIRIVEDQAPTMDARTIAINLVHRFRQDGIQKSSINPNSYVLPFAPRGEERDKQKIMLNLLIPSGALRFPENALTTVEHCALHFMSSNTVELQKRGDENTVCKRVAQYRRHPRHASKVGESEEFSESAPRAIEAVERFGGLPFDDISECPVENGVVYTPWGEVHAGTLIAGIAAGYEPQSYNFDNFKVDSKFAVTIAGDLVEVALREGAEDAKYSIGARGGFNSTLAPHWYFMESKTRVLFTNPELRADLDGLILAMNVRSWSDKYRNMKVSQFLDAYYSNRGIFSSKIKACNRNTFAMEYAPTDILIEQTVAFAELYNNRTTLTTSPDHEDIQQLSKDVVRMYNSMISTIANVNCDEQDLDRTVTDLIIVIDTTWRFDFIHRTVSYVLDNLDINKFESNYTVINAKDGSIIVNSTWSLSKFAQFFNRTIYDQSAKGLDAYKAMATVEDFHEERAKVLQEGKKLNGKSSTVLFMLKDTDSSQGSSILSRFSSVMDVYYPGTQYIILGTGNKDVYNSFVRNPSLDIFIANENFIEESDLKQTLNNLVKRVREVPRKIINPSCGSRMSGDTRSGSMDLYIEPGTKSNFRVARQFLSLEGEKTLKLRSSSNGNITVCTGNGDDGPIDNCQVLGSGELSFQMTSGSDFSFGLIAGHTSENSHVRCADIRCRFPDNIKVTLEIDGFGCENNSGERISTTFISFIIIMIIFVLRNLYTF